MKKRLFLFAAVVLCVLSVAGCSLFGPDVIVGKWQQVSVNGVSTVLLTVVEFTENTYTGSVLGVTTNSGTWTKSGSAYTLNGSFFGLVGTTSPITPSFTNSSNTLSYTDKDGWEEIYNRQ